VVNDVNKAAASRGRRRAAQGSDGYNLIEILITLAVASTVIAMALPTTMKALRVYRLTAAASAATGAISATRYQAIMHAYPYQITFDPNNLTYQVACEPPGQASFTVACGTPGQGGSTVVTSPVPISGVGDVTISQTTTLQFNANGTVSATTGAMSFTISDPTIKRQYTITVTGVGDVSSQLGGM
jgi:prepilin-type N-terminal cleavage/methylation domain-containing protein